MKERDKNQAQIHICSLGKKKEKKNLHEGEEIFSTESFTNDIKTPTSLYIFIYNLVNFDKNPTNYTSLERELNSLQS